MAKKADKKLDYVVWGLDEPTPSMMDTSLVQRQKLFKRITRRLDRITFLLLISTVVQVALIYTIYTQL